MPVAVVDVGGSFARFLKTAPETVREEMARAVKSTTAALARRMVAFAPVGPESSAPHIRDEMEAQSKGLVGMAGIIDNDEQAHVALYNEFTPNRQPFMRPAAEATSGDLKQQITKALRAAEQRLSR